MKSKGIAYLLWLLSGFGWLGFHHFYLGKIFKGILWILTGGMLGIGSFIDLFTLGSAVENYNIKTELDTIRAATLAKLRNNTIIESPIDNIPTSHSKQLDNSSLNNEEKIKNSIANSNENSPSKLFQTYLPKNNILKYGLGLIIILFLAGIINFALEPNYSDPQIVIERFEKYWFKGNYDKCFSHLSKESQSAYKSLDNYIKLKSISDSVLDRYKLISVSSTKIPQDDYQKFKLYKVSDRLKFKNDTITIDDYCTLYNENGKWKMVGISALIVQAQELFAKGDFDKSAEIYKNAIKLDPFSISSKIGIVWCYLRDNEKPDYWEDSTIYHLNFALKLDSINGDIYNTIGAYYSNTSNYKKAIDNFLWSAEYYKDSSSIAVAYSNASQNAKNYNVSLAEEYLKKSLNFNNKSRFAWQTYGDMLYTNQSYRDAKEKYKKAIDLIENDNNLDNHTLISLYGQYALTCKKIGLKKEAEEYILKCIRVYPDKGHPIFKELNL